VHRALYASRAKLGEFVWQQLAHHEVPVVDITADIRRIHAKVNPTLQEFLGVYRTLARRIESLSAELNRDPDEATKKEVARFAQYADTIKKTATLLESLMK
jgi:hypothetical protein